MFEIAYISYLFGTNIICDLFCNNFSPNAGKYGSEKLRICIPFTQCLLRFLCFIRRGVCRALSNISKEIFIFA